MKDLKNWIKDNNVNCIIEKNLVNVEGVGKFLYVKPDSQNGRIIDSDYSIILSFEDYDFLEDNKEINNIIFKFGNRFYYCDSNNRKKNEYNEQVIIPEFKDFKNLGDKKIDFPNLGFVNLGIHTGYELLNGSEDASNWVKKGKFFKQNSLGICEKNTLAGTLPFQLECKKLGIKSILGETVSVAYNYSSEKEHQDIYELKLYVKNKKGWQNLLRISKEINVDYDGFIPLENLLKKLKGLVVVFPREGYFFENIYNKKSALKDLVRFKKYTKDIYIQLDLTEFQDDEFDIDNLKRIKQYFKSFYKQLEPVYIEDIYYTDKKDSKVKEMLNKVGNINSPSSLEQYFKGVDEIVEKYTHLFKDDLTLDLFLKALMNAGNIAEFCNFEINTGEHKLPKYEFLNGKNKVDFYNDLVEKGFQEKILSRFNNDEKIIEYLDRVDKENLVIVGADLIDYFLILWDIVKWCKSENILVGPGRGSAGGSLIAYLLNIIEIDPIEYNLLFERFLNETRVSGERAKSADSLPDIDLDFESSRRNDVKKYMEDRFGFHHVCSIGTYSRMKPKSAIKDFSRVKGLDFKKVNFATKEIPDSISFNWGDIISNALKSKVLKDFVQENVDICEIIKSPLGQPRSASVHPSAVIIVPKEDSKGNKMEVYDWMPIKIMDGQTVSEWEGKYIDRAGFLKEDILGISQLDKFKKTLELIKQNRNIEIDLNKIPIDDEKVFRYFSKGWNEDVFQFGTSGLKTFSIQVKPKNIEDLISMNALFRPGPMESKAHQDFVNFRNKKKKPTVDIGMEEVVKDTQGLYIFQEQVMQAMVVGGLSLVEADMVRTYMKKFDKENMDKFKKKFIKGYSQLLIKNSNKKISK